MEQTFSPNQKKRKDIYDKVLADLDTTEWNEEEKKTDACIFFSIINPKENNIAFSGDMRGTTNSLIQLFLNVIEDKDCPNSLKQAILTAAANIIYADKTDPGAKVVSAVVSIYVEKNYGHINCDCPKCQDEKRSKLKNININ